jgi:hypothetical protein
MVADVELTEADGHAGLVSGGVFVLFVTRVGHVRGTVRPVPGDAV